MLLKSFRLFLAIRIIIMDLSEVISQLIYCILELFVDVP